MLVLQRTLTESYLRSHKGSGYPFLAQAEAKFVVGPLFTIEYLLMRNTTQYELK